VNDTGEATATWFLVPLVLLLIPLLELTIAEVQRRLLVRRFRSTWGPQGKRGVFVYSDSRRWKEYIEAAIAPRVADLMVIVNLSQPADWTGTPPIELKLYRFVRGESESHPMAIVIPRGGHVEVIRFFDAFRDSNHGDPTLLNQQEAKLFRLLGVAERESAPDEARS
jgi:hypothetical protein